MQQEITRTLRQIDTDIREFTKCLEWAAKEQSLDEQKQCEKQVRDLKLAMKGHQSQISAWTSRFGAKLCSKDKLIAARSRLERELRRCQELEKEMKLAAASKRVTKRLNVGKDGATTTKNPICPELPVGAETLEAEVKIMSDQLCSEDKEELETAKEFVCQICFHVVGNTPKLATCSHLFCGDCIGKWIEVQPGNQSWAGRASLGGAVPCPICKEPLQKDTDLHAVSPDSDNGNSAILWQMLCGVKVMCANHSRCNPDGNCNWTGDYGSYQAHIHSCANTPLAQFEKQPSNHADIPDPDPTSIATSSDVKLEGSAQDVETTASESSEHVDLESVSGSENASLPDHSEGFVSSGDGERYPGSVSDCEEPLVESHEIESNSLTSLIADLISLRVKESCPEQEVAEETLPVEVTHAAAAQETDAVSSTLNAHAAPFEPTKVKKAPKTKRISKEVPRNIHVCHTHDMQVAALQYRAAQAQMAQMAYLHRLRSAQIAHYQAAYLQAHQMSLAQRRARQ